jgi:hypothetical protein
VAALGLRMVTCECISVFRTIFRPATKAHPAFVVDDLQTLTTRLADAGFPCEDGKPFEGFHRTNVFYPFGNRMELMEVVVR